MGIPIMMLQLIIVSHTESSFMLAMLILIPIDLGMIFEWRNHVISLTTHSMVLLLVTFLYPKTVPKESILNLSDISQSAMIFAT